MIKNQKDQLTYYQFKKFSIFPELLHFISTRSGGMSSPPFDQLNLSYKHDLKHDVSDNRKILAEALGISTDNFCFARQNHGNQVLVAEDCKAGIPEADALISQTTKVCLVVTSADCVPLLFFDPVRKVIGAAHSGWRGTVSKIATQTIYAMQQNFGSQITDIRVGIGPCIGVDNYEVGEDVVLAVTKAYGEAEELLPYYHQTQKRHFDLIKANLFQLKELNIPQEHIETTNICTYQNTNEFFSYRKQKGKVGVFGTGIMLI